MKFDIVIRTTRNTVSTVTINAEDISEAMSVVNGRFDLEDVRCIVIDRCE